MTINNNQEKNIPPPSSHLAHPKYRPDIDGLRAIAVLSVVVFHADPKKLQGGFIGVDIFFVISGFLISTIIFRSLARDDFSFSQFYSRRIRRIFPALLIVLIACFTIGWIVMLAEEYKQLGKHVAAGAGFVSNFALWSESGYFDTAADTKPLLHLWSLGIEEQFYIVWPLLLWATWKKRFNFLTITASVAVISFALNLANFRNDGVANFYSPQTRFWELLSGSLLAYFMLQTSQFWAKIKINPDSYLNKVISKKASEKICAIQYDVLSVLGAVCITASLLLITKEDYFPGFWALLPVLGTVMVIAAGKDAWLNRVILSHRILVWFGLISFPLYLWHWPLLSFAEIIHGGTPPYSIRRAAVLISIFLAWVTYRLIEHPLRFGKHNKMKVISLTALMILVGYVGYSTYQRDGLPYGKSIRDWEKAHVFLKWQDADNVDSICQKHFKNEYGYCKLTKDDVPTIALVGDSLANSFFQGMSDEYKKVGDNLVMLGAGGCPPLLDIESGYAGQRDWCNSMSSNALKEVATIPSIHTVILAANWHLYINGTRFHKRYNRPWVIRVKEAKEKTNALAFSEKIEETINILVESGKKIIIIKQTPELNLSPASCLIDRPLEFRDKVKDCKVSAESVKSYLAEYEQVFDQVLQNDARVLVLDPYPIICPGTSCTLMDGIYPIYRDDIHLSLYGSKYLASRLKLF